MRRLLILTVAVVSAACSSSSNGSAPTPSSTTATQKPTTPAPEATDPALNGTEQVQFPAADGTSLYGRLFGSGKKAVILSHGGAPAFDQTDWLPVARALERHGYVAFTYNYRGVCNPYPLSECSSGGVDFGKAEDDLEGAIAELHDRGVDSITLAGADVGGTVSLDAASKPGADFAGVVSLGGEEEEQGYTIDAKVIEAIDEPMLLVVGKQDAKAYPSFQDWVEWSNGKAETLMFDTSLHGPYLLNPIAPSDQPIPGKIVAAMLAFLQQNA